MLKGGEDPCAPKTLCILAGKGPGGFPSGSVKGGMGANCSGSGSALKAQVCGNLAQKSLAKLRETWDHREAKMEAQESPGDAVRSPGAQ